MSQLSRKAIALLVCGTLALTTGCISASDTAPSSDAEAPDTTAADAPPADEQTTSEGTYKKAETEEGTGNLSGEVRWNSEGTTNLDVMLCSQLSTIMGLSCDGEEFNTKTGEDGTFSFTNVPTGEYNLAVRVFDTDNWIFQTEGFGISPAALNVEESKELKTQTVDLYKLMDASAPSDQGSVDSATPTLSWAEQPEAEYYELYLSATDNAPPYEDGLVGFKVTETEYTVEAPLIKCEYTWRIEAFNADEVKIYSTDLLNFKVAGCQPPASEGEGE